MHTVTFQREIRPEIPNVYGAADYKEFRETLMKIDEILDKSGLENKLVSQALEQYVANNQIEPTKFYNSKKAGFHYNKFRHALHCVSQDA